jgi:hypothetical protein
MNISTRTVAIVLSIFAGSAAAFSDEQKKTHPCLNSVAMPWSLSLVKQSEIPSNFGKWSPAYVGHWSEQDGSKVCTAVFISSVKDNGFVRATYTNAEPYKRVHQLTGDIKVVDGRQVMTISNDANSWSITYVLEDDGGVQAKTWTGKSGALVPVR